MAKEKREKLTGFHHLVHQFEDLDPTDTEKELTCANFSQVAVGKKPLSKNIGRQSDSILPYPSTALRQSLSPSFSPRPLSPSSSFSPSPLSPSPGHRTPSPRPVQRTPSPIPVYRNPSSSPIQRTSSPSPIHRISSPSTQNFLRSLSPIRTSVNMNPRNNLK